MQEKKKQYILDDLLRIILAMFVLTVLFAFSCLLLSHGARGIWLAVLAQFTLLGVLGGVFLRRCLRIVQKNEQVMQLYAAGYTIADICHLKCYFSRGTEMALKKAVALLDTGKLLSVSKRQAQYLALQNQINPHFLYNTLEGIRSEAVAGGLNVVADMTEYLAKFFRYTISNMENMVTLEEELDNINTYFLIQKYRFEERIGLTIEYDEEEHDLLNHCLLPKLTLQPVVENSIIHGIERKMGFSTVRIVLRCTEKRLIIQVSDDGIGMQPEALDDLNRKLNQSLFESLHNKKKKGGIALVNVNNRIHLIFGEEYGMTVYSTPGVGTDVMIELPLVTSRRELKKVDFNKV